MRLPFHFPAAVPSAPKTSPRTLAMAAGHPPPPASHLRPNHVSFSHPVPAAHEASTEGVGEGGYAPRETLSFPSAGGIIWVVILDTSQKSQWNQAPVPRAETLKWSQGSFSSLPCAWNDLTSPPPNPHILKSSSRHQGTPNSEPTH